MFVYVAMSEYEWAYLTLCFQIGKVTVAKFATIEWRLWYAGHHREINTRSANNALIYLVVAVIEYVIIG